ncbi:hypothetical protein BG003_001087, partial [Podila horticola]
MSSSSSSSSTTPSLSRSSSSMSSTSTPSSTPSTTSSTLQELINTEANTLSAQKAKAIFKHFTRDPQDNQQQCNYCPVKYGAKTGSSNLDIHLKNHHPTQHREALIEVSLAKAALSQPPPDQPQISTHFQPATPYPQAKQDRFNRQ